MKTYLFYAILVLCTNYAFGQSCPPNATIDGHLFSVVQLGNQCFYGDPRSEYLNAALATVTGFTTDLPGIPSLGVSNVTAEITSNSFSNYHYSFSQSRCKKRNR